MSQNRGIEIERIEENKSTGRDQTSSDHKGRVRKEVLLKWQLGLVGL